MEAMKGTSLLGKLKSVISVIYSILLWMTKVLPSSVQTLKLAFPCHDRRLRNLDLRNLLSSTARGTTSTICSYIVPPPPPPSPSSLSSLLWQASSTSLSWSYSTSGDLLGTESGVHMSSDEEILQEELKYKRAQLLYLKSSSTTTAAQRKQEQVGYGATKEYPPTIPCLARALTREYVDGRLILREERGKKLRYMDAERENGRLRLTLVPLYDTSSDEEDEEEEEEPEFIGQEEDGKSIDEDFEAENEEDKSDGDGGNENEIEEIEEEVGNCRRRCFTYTGNGIPTSSSLFGLPIPVRKCLALPNGFCRVQFGAIN